ncbi:hypothetical protein FB567DRAFT_597104 [Paraphoma chrysanthemicola]|uniref:Uncharacterized protein n=1 Tax=Paraphoma chrysanthemicola TaxID=798071 RepID=A0A8K0QYM4_9PLEO|nr:hypothetical protein FB567DRAFT_597104 [Paraphoma chrysanthemicola]
MSSKTLTALNISFLVTSIILIILSSVDLYMIIHPIQSLKIWFPAGRYEWRDRPYGSGWQKVTGHVSLYYDTRNEDLELAATAFALTTGVLGLVGFFVAKKNNKQAGSTPLTTVFLVLPSTITLFLSLIAIIYTSVHNKFNNDSTCTYIDGYRDGHLFGCTRENAACHIIKSITDTNWADNDRICRELKAGRLIIAGIVSVTALSLAAAAGRWWVRLEKKESANERVARLVGEE